MFCQGDKICNVCAGELYYQMGIENIGLISNIIGSSITTLALKQFHDTSIKLQEIDVFNYID